MLQKNPLTCPEVMTANVDTKTGFNHVYENIYYEVPETEPTVVDHIWASNSNLADSYEDLLHFL